MEKSCFGGAAQSLEKAQGVIFCFTVFGVKLRTASQ